MNNKFQLVMACGAALAAATAVAAAKNSPSPSPSAHASPAPKATAAAEKKETPGRALPFHGKVAAVDQTAKTFTLAGKESSRVFKVTEKTVVTKSGGAGTIKDIMANEQVSGSYWKSADGSLEAKTVKLGPKPDTEMNAETKVPANKTTKKSADASPSPSASPKP